MGIAKAALHLPPSSRDLQVGRLLTALSQILRSKSQDTRDLVRDTICRIAVILGSPYLPVLLLELRAALLRGPQLHVLAFVSTLCLPKSRPRRAAMNLRLKILMILLRI